MRIGQSERRGSSAKGESWVVDGNAFVRGCRCYVIEAEELPLSEVGRLILLLEEPATLEDEESRRAVCSLSRRPPSERLPVLREDDAPPPRSSA